MTRKHWKRGVNWETFAKKHDISNFKTHDLNTDEIIVPVQSMFPNCQKYEPCCKESGTEEMMEKFKKMTEKPIERISHQAKKGNRINIIKKVKPVKKNPFPDADVLGRGIQ